jgi:hypothetical protein
MECFRINKCVLAINGGTRIKTVWAIRSEFNLECDAAAYIVAGLVP